MSNDWFRSWHGAPTDPKWMLIAKRANVKPIHVSGTWWALLDHASQHPERGRVDDFDVETFALFAGMEEAHVSRIVTELITKGLIVAGRIAQWGKRQPKREDDTANDRQRNKRARDKEIGGNPPSGGTPGTPDHPETGLGHAMSRNVTLDEEKRREDSSDANASGTVVPLSAAAFCKAVFDSTIPLLTATGRTEREARSVIGRWRQALGGNAHGDAELLTLVSEATNKSEPLEWLMAAVEIRNGNRTGRIPARQPGIRGTRPDPALDMLAAARAAQAAASSSGDWGDRGEARPALPAVWTG
jgi:hypothetical protein